MFLTTFDATLHQSQMLMRAFFQTFRKHQRLHTNKGQSFKIQQILITGRHTQVTNGQTDRFLGLKCH